MSTVITFLFTWCFRNYLLSSSEDGTIRLWSLQTFTCLVGYKGHNYPVWDTQFSPHGYYFVSGGHDRVARFVTIVFTFLYIIVKSWLKQHFCDVAMFYLQPVGNRSLPASEDICRSLSWCHMHTFPPKLKLCSHGIIRPHNSPLGCADWKLCSYLHWTQGKTSSQLIYDIKAFMYCYSQPIHAYSFVSLF